MWPQWVDSRLWGGRSTILIAPYRRFAIIMGGRRIGSGREVWHVAPLEHLLSRPLSVCAIRSRVVEARARRLQFAAEACNLSWVLLLSEARRSGDHLCTQTDHRLTCDHFERISRSNVVIRIQIGFLVNNWREMRSSLTLNSQYRMQKR
jgi:hypothetical protein